MSADVRDLGVLLQLRVKLLLRRGISRYTRSARDAAPVRLVIALLVAGWILVSLVVPLTFYFVQALANPHSRTALGPSLAFYLSAGEALIFFYAVTSLAVTFTTRNDLALLLATPVSPAVVFGEKILSASLGFSLILVIAAPGLIGIGRALHAGIGYDLLVLLAILLAPLLPVALAMLLLLAVLRWFPPARVRGGVAVLGLVVGMTFFIALQLFSSSGAGHPTALPSLPAALPSTWLGGSLAAGALGQVGASLAYLLGAALLALLTFGVATALSARLLVTGIATYQQVGRRARQPAGIHPRSRHFPAAHRLGDSPFMALLHVDWLSLRRDPQGLVTLAYPLVIVGFYAYRIFGDPSTMSALGGTAFLHGSLYAMLTFTGILLAGSLAPLVVNREGYSLYLLALAPLRVRTVLLARWMICLIPIVTVTEVILVAGALFLRIPWDQALLAGFALAALVTALIAVNVAVNVLWPRFEARTGRRSGSYLAAIVSFVADLVVGGAIFTLLTVTLALWGSIAALLTALALFLVAALVIAAAGLAGSYLLGGFLTGRRPIPYSAP